MNFNLLKTIIEEKIKIERNTARRNMYLYCIIGIGGCIFGVIIIAIIAQSSPKDLGSLFKLLQVSSFITITLTILKKGNDCKKSIDYYSMLWNIIKEATKLSPGDLHTIKEVNEQINKGETITDNISIFLKKGEKHAG